MIKLLAALSLCTALGQAHALNLDEYERIKDQELVKLYVSGVGQGIFWANTATEGKKLYCPPPGLTMNIENFNSTLNKQIAFFRTTAYYKADAPIELLMLRGLQNTFPCE
jgi:hypothetical protein